MTEILFAKVTDVDVVSAESAAFDALQSAVDAETAQAAAEAAQIAAEAAAAAAVVATVVIALIDGATPALDAELGNFFYLDAGGDRTIAVPSNPTDGQKIVIRHFANGAARTLALNTGAGGFRYGSDVTGLTATADGKMDYIGCIYNDVDSFWDVVSYSKGF